jgi:hypothetical protein
VGGGCGAVCEDAGEVTDVPCACACAIFRTLHTLTAGGGFWEAVWAATMDRAADVRSLERWGSPFTALTLGASLACANGDDGTGSGSCCGADELGAGIELGAESWAMVLEGGALVVVALLAVAGGAVCLRERAVLGDLIFCAFFARSA